MIIGACTIQLYLPGVFSLKEKRGVLKPLLNQLRRQFEVAAAEVGNQDTWQSADIAVIAVSNESGHIYAVLEKAVYALPEKHREAIRWWYVYRRDPVGMARLLGVSKQGLADLVNAGRTMLQNRLQK